MVDIWVHLGVLDDVSIRHPWAHDAKWNQCLGNLNNREYMGNGLAPNHNTTEGLVEKHTKYTFDKIKESHTLLISLRRVGSCMRIALMHTGSP